MEKIKIAVPFRSHSTRNRKFQKNRKKLKQTIMASFQAKIAIKLKKLKYNITAAFQGKIGWKMPRKRKNKNYRSVSFLHNA